MTLVGFLLFLDPLKPDVKKTIRGLVGLGIKIRVITGDSKPVALYIAGEAGLNIRQVLTGAELEKMSAEALANAVEATDIFAEVNPGQKERIVLALKKNGHVVGYMGDGINDVPALHAADVSISINTAVDVAKESADFVLRKKSLAILKRGIVYGREIFANTMKYINVTTSANFGNIFSMAFASLLLPYLPLLPKQILLINFISDFPAMTIAGDFVDAEMISAPHKWNIKSIRKFMFTFGFVSSAFDILTFAVLLLVFSEQEELFRSGWFILSILTELLALLIMRTRKPFFRSKPAPILLYSSVAVGIITLILPYLPLEQIFGIVPIPPLTLLALFGVAILYVVTTEIIKHFYYREKSAK
jgi:Mg2+-importing ATPase